MQRPCPSCRGMGWITDEQECPVCGGQGWVDCPEPEHPCETCRHQLRMVSCPPMDEPIYVCQASIHKPLILRVYPDGEGDCPDWQPREEDA